MSEKSRRRYHGPVSRDIANLYIDSQTYDLSRGIMPKRLAKDTEKVLKLIGFTEDNDDPDGW